MGRSESQNFFRTSLCSKCRVKIVVMYLKGKAEYWWRGTGCNSTTLPWHHFCIMLEDRFTETSTYKVVGQFHNIKQTGSVTEYIDKFEELGLVKRHNPQLTDEYFTFNFVVGLKEYI